MTAPPMLTIAPGGWLMLARERYSPDPPTPGEELWRELLSVFGRLANGQGSDADYRTAVGIARLLGVGCAEVDRGITAPPGRGGS